MNTKIKNYLNQCRQKLESDRLQTVDLDELEALITTSNHRRNQTIMYLYSKSTNMRSPLSGWSVYDPYRDDEPELPSQDPPYRSVLDAVGDGWRILQFPRPENFPFSDIDNSYLAFEFILEKFI